MKKKLDCYQNNLALICVFIKIRSDFFRDSTLPLSTIEDYILGSIQNSTKKKTCQSQADRQMNRRTDRQTDRQIKSTHTAVEDCSNGWTATFGKL